MTTLGVSNQRAMSDLLGAERQLREQSERSIQEFRTLLLVTALRLDGERDVRRRGGEPCGGGEVRGEPVGPARHARERVGVGVGLVR